MHERMTRGPISWDHWRSFLAVIDEGSLTGAARSLGLTQPTLGRHVDALEAALQSRLFSRAPDGMLPTPAALALEDQARQMQATAAALSRAASAAEDAAQGTIRLAASEIVGAEILPPILADFAARHPRIEIELLLDNRNADLLRQTADIAVRMVRPVQKALVMRALGRAELGLYAHRDHVRRAGRPDSMADLRQHRLIGPEGWRGLAGVTIGGVPVTPDWFHFRCDSDFGQLALLRAGLGIGICQHAIARRDPDLLPILPENVAFALEPHLVYPEALRGLARIRLLAEHLARACAQVWAGSGPVVLGAAHHDKGGD
jgi:DNA-binding transcriptional LysR family regulator